MCTHLSAAQQHSVLVVRNANKIQQQQSFSESQQQSCLSSFDRRRGYEWSWSEQKSEQLEQKLWRGCWGGSIPPAARSADRELVIWGNSYIPATLGYMGSALLIHRCQWTKKNHPGWTISPSYALRAVVHSYLVTAVDRGLIGLLFCPNKKKSDCFLKSNVSPTSLQSTLVLWLCPGTR